MDGIFEGAEGLDFDFDLVAVLEVDGGFACHADAGGRSGEDQIAGFQGHDAGEVGDDEVNGEDELRGAGILHGVAVESELDAEVVRVLDFIGGDEFGPEGGEGIEGFAGEPLLAGLVELPIARGDVMADGVAGDACEGMLLGDAACAFADDGDELGLVINLLAFRGELNGGAVADEGGGELGEEDGFLGDGHAGLGGVVLVVESEADDFLGVWDRWEEDSGFSGVGDVGLGSSCGPGGAGECLRAEGEDLAEGCGEAGIGGVEIDIAVGRASAGAGSVRGIQGSETHDQIILKVNQKMFFEGTAKGGAGDQPRPQALRARSRTTRAVLRARAAPAARTDWSFSGCAAQSARRARAGAKWEVICSARRFFTSP